MERKQKACVIAIGLSVVLWLLSLLLVAIYYNGTGKFPYPDPISWKELLRSASRLRLTDFIAGGSPWFDALVGISFILSTMCCTTFWRIRVLWIYFMVQGTSFLVLGGWMGVVAIALHAVGVAQLDGEWLAEHWPKVEALGVWGMVSLGIAVTQAKQLRPNQAL